MSTDVRPLEDQTEVVAVQSHQESLSEKLAEFGSHEFTARLVAHFHQAKRCAIETQRIAEESKDNQTPK